MRQLSGTLEAALAAGKPQRILLVFMNGDEMSNEDISISSGVTLNETFTTQQNLNIGECPSSTFSFTALNDQGQLDDFTFGWFRAYIGARIDSGTPTMTTRTFTEGGQQVTYEFDSLGVFYAERPIVTSQKMISITAYDRMKLFEADVPALSNYGLTYPTTIGGIIQAIIAWAREGLSYPWDFELENPGFLNNSLTVSSRPAEFSDATVRDVVGWIAECACSVARFNRDGNLQFYWFVDSETEYDEHDYSEYSHTWYHTQAINGLYVRDVEAGTQSSIGTKTNNYLIQDNPFLRG